MKRTLVLSMGLMLAVVTNVMAQQQILAVYFEEIDGISAMSYVFTIHSATMQPVGYRTLHIPQIDQPIGNVNTYTWFQNENILTLQFLTTTDVLRLTGYDPEIDVLFFDSRYPGYWAGCRSPYIPAGIPPDFASYFCSQVGLTLSDEARSSLAPGEDTVLDRRQSADTNTQPLMR
jgi:hypothetical protein